MDDLESLNQELVEFAVQESIQDDDKSATTSRSDPQTSNKGDLKQVHLIVKTVSIACSAALGRSHPVKPLLR